MQIKILSGLIIIINLFVACVEEFSPQIDGYLEIPVIDGAITNEPGPYIVKLSKTLAVDDLDYFPISGASIVIYDNFDTKETLVELEPGVYSTNPSGIRGEVGRSYRISVEINGETYQSDFEELKSPVTIDSIYSTVEYKETAEGSYEGLQFYINTELSNDDNKYFLWIPVETYEYKSDLELNYIYMSSWLVDTIRNPAISTCWRTEEVNEIFTFTTKNIVGTNINNYPIHYVNTSTKKLSEKYSLLIKQFTISEETYKYWNEIKKQSTESGSMYTTQPFKIKGNMVNLSNPNDNVLGYFMVAGVSRKRVFVEKPLLDFTYVECESDVEGFANLKDPPSPWPVYVTEVSVGEGTALGMARAECFYCEEQGGTDVKPEFWED